MELGKRLKEKRIEKQITLDELQSITKIQKRYLEAVEEENFAILPGKFYARAFIKQYAEAVGLDPDQLFDEFVEVIPKTVKEEVPITLSRSSKKRVDLPFKNTGVLLSILPKVLVGILVFGLAVSIWVFLQDSPNSVQPDDSTDMNETVESEMGATPTAENEEQVLEEQNGSNPPIPPDSPEQQQVEEEQKQLVQVSQETNGTTPYTIYELSGGKQFILTIKAKPNDRSYIGIENGIGKSFYGKEMNNQAGETFDFSKEEEIELNIGRVQGVEVIINDEPLTFKLEQAHQKVKIINKQEGE